jgi:hypothetical protein
MSKLCFSFPADTPGNGPGRAIPPPGLGDPLKMPSSCHSYPNSCFGYPDGTLRGDGNPGAAQPPPPGLRRMPTGPCFRY